MINKKSGPHPDPLLTNTKNINETVIFGGNNEVTITER